MKRRLAYYANLHSNTSTTIKFSPRFISKIRISKYSEVVKRTRIKIKVTHLNRKGQKHMHTAQSA